MLRTTASRKENLRDHTPLLNTHPKLAWIIPLSDYKMAWGTSRYEQAKRLTRENENAPDCLHKRRVTLLVHAMPMIQSTTSSLRFGTEWILKN